MTGVHDRRGGRHTRLEVARAVADTAGMRTLLAEPGAAWRRAPTAWRLAYVVGTALMAVGLAHGIAWLVLGGAWDGPISFRKPYTFGVSFGLTTITLAWFADRLGLGRRAGWLLLAPLAAANTSEVVWVSLQRARGVASHFNFATALDRTLYIVAGGGAIAVTSLVVVVLTVLAFARRTDDPALTLAIRSGLVLLLVAVADGVAMIMVGSARASDGQTAELVRWGTAGNMRVTHFLGLHGIQVLSALAVSTSGAADGLRDRVRLVAVAAAAWAVLVLAGTLQWLNGRAVTQPGPVDGTLALLAVMSLVAVAVRAARLARRRGPVRSTRAA